jgi:hypothetical protein
MGPAGSPDDPAVEANDACFDAEVERTAGGVVGLVAGTAGQAEAHPIAWTGPSDLDDAAISYAPILVTELQSVTGPGYAHNHGALGTVYTNDVHYQVSGVWQTTFATMLPDGGDHTLRSLVPPPATFAMGLIDRLRLTAPPDVGQAYHRSAAGATGGAPYIRDGGP